MPILTNGNDTNVNTELDRATNYSSADLCEPAPLEQKRIWSFESVFSLLIGIMALFNIVSALRPITGSDESIYYVLGRGLRYGLFPYRDFWDTKPIGMYWATCLLSYIPMALGRIVMIAAFAGALYWLSFCMGRTRRREGLALAVGGIAIFFSPLFSAPAVLTEPLEALFVLLSWGAIIRACAHRHTITRYCLSLISGALLGFAANIRPTAAAAAIPVILFMLFGKSDAKPRRALLLFWLAGIACTVIVIVSVLRNEGILTACLDQVLRANYQLRNSTTGKELLNAWQTQVGFLWEMSFAIVLAVAGVLSLRNQRSVFAILFSSSAIIGLAEGFATRRGYAHHFMPFVFALLPIAFEGYLYITTLPKKVREIIFACLAVLSIGPLLFWSGARCALTASELVHPSARLQSYLSLRSELEPQQYAWSGIGGGELFWYTSARPSSPYFQISSDFLRAIPSPWEKIASDFKQKPPALILVPTWWIEGRTPRDGSCPLPIAGYIEFHMKYDRALPALDAIAFVADR